MLLSLLQVIDIMQVKCLTDNRESTSGWRKFSVLETDNFPDNSIIFFLFTDTNLGNSDFNIEVVDYFETCKQCIGISLYIFYTSQRF